MLFYYPQQTPTEELLNILVFFVIWGGIILSVVLAVFRKPILRVCRSSGRRLFANTSSIEVCEVKGRRSFESHSQVALVRGREEHGRYEHASYSQALDDARDAFSDIGWFPHLCGQTYKMTLRARSRHE